MNIISNSSTFGEPYEPCKHHRRATEVYMPISASFMPAIQRTAVEIKEQHSKI